MEGAEGQERGAGGRAVPGTAHWDGLHSPLEKSLLSVGSRSTSLPPESEGWELWEAPVPRGGWLSESPCSLYHLLGTGSRPGTQGLRDIWGKEGCISGEAPHL